MNFCRYPHACGLDSISQHKNAVPTACKNNAATIHFVHLGPSKWFIVDESSSLLWCARNFIDIYRYCSHKRIHAPTLFKVDFPNSSTNCGTHAIKISVRYEVLQWIGREWGKNCLRRMICWWKCIFRPCLCLHSCMQSQPSPFARIAWNIAILVAAFYSSTLWPHFHSYCL